jgi:hypothetical protein
MALPYRFPVSALRPGQGPLSKMVGSAALSQISLIKSGGMSVAQVHEVLGEALGSLQDQINALNTLARQIQQYVEVDGSALPFTPPGGSSGEIQVNDGAGGFAGLASTGTGNAVRATSPTIVTPTIASFTNATHNHENGAGGGQLDEDALALTDVTTNNAATTKHGFLKKLSNTATEYMNGAGNWAVPTGTPGGSSGDIQTNNGSGAFAALASTGTGNAVRASSPTIDELTATGDIHLPDLPSSAGASGTLFYDPGDGNRVKYVP